MKKLAFIRKKKCLIQNTLAHGSKAFMVRLSFKCTQSARIIQQKSLCLLRMDHVRLVLAYLLFFLSFLVRYNGCLMFVWMTGLIQVSFNSLFFFPLFYRHRLIKNQKKKNSTNKHINNAINCDRTIAKPELEGLFILDSNPYQ